MDPVLMGAGSGLVEDEIVTCPRCGCESPVEGIRMEDDECDCPECLFPLEEG